MIAIEKHSMVAMLCLASMLVLPTSCARISKERKIVDALSDCPSYDRATAEGWTVLNDSGDPIVVSAPMGFTLFNPGYGFHHGGTVWRRGETILERTNAWSEYSVPDNSKPCRTTINGMTAVVFEGRRSDDAAYEIVAWYFLPRPWYEFRDRSIEDQPLLAAWSERSDELQMLRAMIYAVRPSDSQRASRQAR